jgi:hypothetical protein
MTVTVAATTNTNTMEYWLNRTNELANAMTTVAVTTNSNTAVGNAAITGSFTANVLIANTVRVSNSTSNVVISVPNTVQTSSGDYFLNANGQWSAVISPVTTFSLETSGTSGQLIDSYPFSDYGAVEFFVRVKNNNANGYQATKILTFHNNVDAFSTEYGSMVSNNSLGSFSVSTNATHVILNMTPTSTNTAVTISRVNF